MRPTAVVTASLLVLFACLVTGTATAWAEAAASGDRDHAGWRLPATPPSGGTSPAPVRLADALVPLLLTAVCAAVLALVTGRPYAPARTRRAPRR